MREVEDRIVIAGQTYSPAFRPRSISAQRMRVGPARRTARTHRYECGLHRNRDACNTTHLREVFCTK